VHDGDVLELGDVAIQVIHTPGHTPEHISLLVIDRTRSSEPWFVLTGHTLMVGDLGRTELATNAEEGARALGCTVFPAGPGNSEAQATAIAALKPRGYLGTPDFLKVILDKAVELFATGYKKGFATIVDANVITMITAAVLFAAATGAVRGFASLAKRRSHARAGNPAVVRRSRRHGPRLGGLGLRDSLLLLNDLRLVHRQGDLLPADLCILRRKHALQRPLLDPPRVAGEYGVDLSVLDRPEIVTPLRKSPS
jgi:hypothetical protein